MSLYVSPVVATMAQVTSAIQAVADNIGAHTVALARDCAQNDTVQRRSNENDAAQHCTRSLHQIPTLQQNFKIVKWMLDTVNLDGERQLASKKASHFPQFFQNSNSAGLMKKKRSHGERKLLLKREASMCWGHFTTSHDTLYKGRFQAGVYEGKGMTWSLKKPLGWFSPCLNEIRVREVMTCWIKVHLFCHSIAVHLPYREFC